MAQISPNIFRVNSEWHTNVPQQEFATIQEAINNVSAWDKVKIILEGDFADQEQLMLTEDNIQVTISGQNQFSIDFRSGEMIAQMGESKTLKFMDMNRLRGDLIQIRDDSNLYLDNCLNVVTTVDIVSGKYVNVYIKNGTNLWGFERNPAIGMYNADSKLFIDGSKVQGGDRSPAIYFNMDSEDKVKIKNSVILHGEAGEAPIQKNTGTIVSIKMYNCFGNTFLCGHDITNLIDEMHHNNLFNTELDF